MAWDAVTLCSSSSGVNQSVVSAVEKASADSFKDEKHRKTPAEARREGIWKPAEVPGVWDVYDSPEDKEIHDLIIKLRLSESDGNHLLHVLRKVQ